MQHKDHEIEVLKPLKTWSHLAGARRRSSEYEIVSVDTLYNVDNPERPLELDTNVHMNRWYRKYREGSALKHGDWKGFRDPDELVYRTYNMLQHGQETYVDGLLDEHDELDHDDGLTDQWVETLSLAYTPMRYLMHTLQMCSGYLTLMAPASTIVNCAALQMGDQLRWLSRVAYRSAELKRNRPGFGFGEDERGHWEDHKTWQPTREMMEKVLIAYDWGETFVALNLVAKPAIDEGFLRTLGKSARRNNDLLLAMLLDAQLRDSDRSRRWSSAVVKYAVDGDQKNRATIGAWIAKWMPLADAAIDAYCATLPDVPEVAAEAKAAVREFHEGLKLGQWVR